MNLNAEQLSAIGSQAKTTKVIAGPGSGKSRALVARIKVLLGQGVAPQEIVVLTFTNNAAHVFSERLAPVRLRYMGTVHGFCMRLIQKYGGWIGYRAGSVSLVTETAKEHMLEIIIRRLGKKISAKELEAEATPDAKLIWAEYRHQLKRANMVDYDQILADGLELLRMPVVTEDLKPIVELLGDELQDSGPEDWGVIWAIPADRRWLAADPDQSIFEFRGGDPTIFIHAAQPEPCRELELTMNYRSDVAICSVANNLIAHNFNRIPKRIVPMTDQMGLVELRTYHQEGEEIYGVWGQIFELKQHGIDYEEIAVLARTNHIVEKYRETLRGLGVPVKHATVRLPSDWRYAMTILSLLVDPANDHHAEEVLRHRVTKERIGNLRLDALQKHRPLSQVSGLITAEYLAGAPYNGRDLTNDLGTLLTFGISQESLGVIRQRMEILPPDASLSDLLTDLWRTDNWMAKDEGAGVTVTTVHRAKGGEWDAVFMVAMEEGLFPHVKTKLAPLGGPGARADAEIDFEKSWAPARIPEDISAIEEERRLAFVGVTRARHRLFISYARQRMAFFKVKENLPSRFIKEMGL